MRNTSNPLEIKLKIMLDALRKIDNDNHFFIDDPYEIASSALASVRNIENQSRSAETFEDGKIPLVHKKGA